MILICLVEPCKIKDACGPNAQCISYGENHRSCICADTYTGTNNNLTNSEVFPHCIRKLFYALIGKNEIDENDENNTNFFVAPPEQQQSGLSTGALVGIIVGSIASVIVLIVPLIFYLNNRKLDLSSLPSEVRWFYEKYDGSHSKWNYEGIFFFFLFFPSLSG